MKVLQIKERILDKKKTLKYAIKNGKENRKLGSILQVF